MEEIQAEAMPEAGQVEAVEAEPQPVEEIEAADIVLDAAVDLALKRHQPGTGGSASELWFA